MSYPDDPWQIMRPPPGTEQRQADAMKRARAQRAEAAKPENLQRAVHGGGGGGGGGNKSGCPLSLLPLVALGGSGLYLAGHVLVAIGRAVAG